MDNAKVPSGKKIRKKNLPIRWSQLSYAGQKRVPLGIEPTAGSWPLFFLKRDPNGRFLDPEGNLIAFQIRRPDNINFNQQLREVQQTLDHITPHQIEVATYWGAGPATKQWTPIIDRLIDTYGQLTAPQEDPIWAARILAVTQAGINDAFTVTWYYKYLWDIPRPNQLDQELETILCTPKFPGYPSGHSVISGCAEVILSYFFPPEAARLQEYAEDNAFARVYAGVHFPVDCSEGLRLGRQIGDLIVNALRKQADSNQTAIDFPITEDLHANLPPPPYEQVIPFERHAVCDSLVR